MSLVTTSSNYGKLHKNVRAVCENVGWDVWFTYNDKGKTDRRLSYARNGWPVPSDMKAKITRGVNKILKEEGIDAKAKWVTSHCWRGSYDKLTIRVPL